MEESAQRETRRALRQVQEHLYQAHLLLGAQTEDLGLVEVVYHPTNTLPDLNYVTPRRKTAWVSGHDVEQGIDYLRKMQRRPRVQYIEGLFPPLFAKTLTGLGLEAEKETPLMIYRAAGFNGVLPPPLEAPSKPDGVTLERVHDQRGVEMWWYVWRNAHYDVLTLGVEPLVVGREMAVLKLGQQIDILMHRYTFPIGVARVSIQQETAHLLGVALMREHRTPEMLKLLQLAAMQAAFEANCELIFAPGESEEDRRHCRALGFADLGSMICYSAKAEGGIEDTHGVVFSQPVLTLR
ncbi:MAG: hypothetical protein HXY40_07910 [Chloroflexi bacterium]|nr:hypothetical protein [Chloroflexota bacterium]